MKGHASGATIFPAGSAGAQIVETPLMHLAE
jgi:hypothetical protein